MTAPQPQNQSLHDRECCAAADRRSRGPVTFADDELLQRRLERRTTDRRFRERRTRVAAPAADLGVRELCHDLRQPLASAVVLMHMLEREADLTAAARQRLELLQSELGRLAAMLNAQLEPPGPVLVDVGDVVRDACAAPGDGTAVALQLHVEEAPLVAADLVQLSRLVTNLVTNARKAAGPGGAVRVHVTDAGGAACIAVEDSGGAVGDTPTSGFGLGLMIVDSVVRRHGGTSNCTPSALGGLRVCVTLPAALLVQE